MKTKIIITAALCALTSCHPQPVHFVAQGEEPAMVSLPSPVLVPPLAIVTLVDDSSLQVHRVVTADHEFLVASRFHGGVVILEQKPFNPKPEKP